MHSLRLVTLTAVLAIFTASVPAQVPVTANPDHAGLLRSNDPQLTKNKKLVYDFWREVLEGGHMELAEKYLLESYIQHNPNVATGRQGFIQAFSRRPPSPIEAKVKAEFVAIMAEGDLVLVALRRERADPKNAAAKYSYTAFDLFRIENGKIAEHWDVALK